MVRIFMYVANGHESGNVRRVELKEFVKDAKGTSVVFRRVEVD